MANKVRLIDANDAKKALLGWESEPTDEEIEYSIDHLPTVDAVEVVHAMWKFVPSEKYGRHYTDAICTSCKAVLDTHCDNDLEYRQENIKKKLLYCPNCGAKMDLEE